MLNFENSIQDVIASQKSTNKASAFTELNSKKKLFAANFLSDEQQKYVGDLKGTFTFHIHSDKRYLIVTTYTTTDKYGFIVVDLKTLKCARVDSIKNAKIAVLEQVKADEIAAKAAEEEAKKQAEQQSSENAGAEGAEGGTTQETGKGKKK